MSSKKPVTKKNQAVVAKETATIAKSSSINIEAALTGIGQAQNKITRSLAEIGEELVRKHAELASVTEAIQIRHDQLNELHEKDQVLLSIDELRAMLEDERLESGRLRNELLDEDARFKAELIEKRKREEAEHIYKRDLDRSKANDQWAEGVRQRNLAEQIRMEAFERDLEARERAMAANEARVSDALAKEATFEQRIKDAVAAEVKTISSAIKRDSDHKAQLDAIAWQADRQGFVKDIATRDQQLVELRAALAAVQERLTAALEAQTTLAKATVDAASNTKAQADAMALMTNIGGGNGQRSARS